MFMYSIGRFFIQFLRIDDVKFTIGGLDIQEGHIVTFLIFIITSIIMIIFFGSPDSKQNDDLSQNSSKRSSGRKRKAQSRG